MMVGELEITQVKYTQGQAYKMLFKKNCYLLLFKVFDF